MTTWYLDPEGGNDANAGTSFALRKKTFSGITLAAGDNVRIIADYGSQSLGSATWTDASATVTLASAATLTLDNCDTAWTAAANVTATATTSNMKQGSDCLQLAFAAGFTSGLVAYKAVSSLDLSAYSCVSLWLSSASTTMAQPLQLALCSDSAGATPIVTLPFPSWLIGNGTWPSRPFPVLFENGGSALPSGVNSIAIYANSGKPFTGNVYVDNVIATKAYGAAGHLSHGCMLGKNTVGEPEWYPIMSIDGTSVVLGGLGQFGTATPAKSYRGVTETVTTYSMSPLRTRMTTAQAKLTGASGTPALPVTYTGGWNRTDMSTQTGTSWLSGEGVQSSGYNNSGTLSWQSLPDSTIGYALYSGNAVSTGAQVGVILYLLGIVSCINPISIVPRSTVDMSLGNLVQNNTGYNPNGFAAAKYRLRIRRITGWAGTGFIAADHNDDTTADIAIGSIDNCNFALGTTSAARIRIRGLSVKNNSSATVATNGNVGFAVLLDRPVLGDASIGAFVSSTVGQVIRCTNVSGNAWDNRVYTYGVTQTITQGTVHGSTAQSLSLLLNDYLAFMSIPYLARIARVACFANKTVTFNAWMQRSTQFVDAGIMVQAGSVAGIADAQAQGSAANATWEQVTLSFTPTENGVVDVFAYIMGQATTSANGTTALFGDTSVSST